MMILHALLSLVYGLSGAAAFVTWWVATYLGVQLSRYRAEPEAPEYRRRWEFSMLVFVGVYGLSVAAQLLASLLR